MTTYLYKDLLPKLGDIELDFNHKGLREKYGINEISLSHFFFNEKYDEPDFEYMMFGRDFSGRIVGIPRSAVSSHLDSTELEEYIGEIAYPAIYKKLAELASELSVSEVS